MAHKTSKNSSIISRHV